MDTKTTESGNPVAQERRKFPRFRCQGSAEIRAGADGAQQWGTITDFSRGGCYIETPAPVGKGQSVSLRLTLSGLSFSVTGIVVIVHPMFGMGVAFTSIDAESAPVAAQVLRKLSESAPSSALQPSPPATASQPVRLSPQAAVTILGQVARHLSAHGVLTQQEFLDILEKNK